MSLFTSVPSEFWFAITVIIIYLGEKIQQHVLIGILRDALNAATKPVVLPPPAPLPKPAPLPPPPPPAPTPAPPPPPVAVEFSAFPAWFQLALHEIGFHETGTNQGLQKYIALAKTGADGDPWCAIFVNAMLEQAGVRGTRSPSSQSFRTDPNFVQLDGPAPGCLVVFWRISKTSGLGHVGFYRGENTGNIWTLGGNENDMVQIEALPKDSNAFGVIGYWWPKSVPIKGGAVQMPTGAAISVKVDPSPPTGKPADVSGHADITATVFSGDHSAYGPPIDDNSPGVALPYRFMGDRPMVRVTGKSSGKSVDALIVDVGPWNTHDPYWETGSRPEAESGIDNTGRKTNRAGIDLTVAAANAIGIDGKGLVSWGFINKVT